VDLVSFKRRSHSSEFPVVVGAHGLPACRWCRKTVLPPRSTFCSQACVHEYKLRSDPAYLRSQAFMRDRGVCTRCGFDTLELRRELNAASPEARARRCEELRIPPHRGEPGMSLWDADHVLPVSKGGGECGLDGIATLCISCHLAKSRAA